MSCKIKLLRIEMLPSRHMLYFAIFYPMKTTGTGNYRIPAGKKYIIYEKG